MTRIELIEYLADNILSVDGLLDYSYGGHNSLPSTHGEIAEFIVKAMEMQGVLLLDFKPQIGDEVYDDLTGKITKIISSSIDSEGHGTYAVDSEYLDGQRYGWEISEVRNEKK
jgi:hypothetical protein